MIEVSMPDGSAYVVKKLISNPSSTDTSAAEADLLREDINPTRRKYAEWIVRKGTASSNTKTAKGAKKGFVTVGLSLAPNKESGYNVCPNTTPGCTAACLFNGGVAGLWAQVRPSQIAKTRAFFQHRAEFDRMLLKELRAHYRKYPDNLVCRLNVYSDLPWERMTPWLFELLPSIQFYDYTKVPTRMQAFVDKQFPPNYHLTFSRSEVNEADCLHFLRSGANVAIVFPEHSFPATWNGFPVVNGDETDLRFLDPSPSVIGLKAKNKFGRRDTTGFVVRSLPTVQL